MLIARCVWNVEYLCLLPADSIFPIDEVHPNCAELVLMTDFNMLVLST